MTLYRRQTETLATLRWLTCELDHDQGLAGRISRSSRASAGRVRSAPEGVCSPHTASQSAARNSSS